MLQDREQSIREGAYQIWEREGRPEGRTLAHWLKAEAELAETAPLAIAKDAVVNDVKPAKARAVRTLKPRPAPSRAKRGLTPP